MKQILQNMSTGETSIVEAPAPSVKSGHILIAARCSLISVGTERMLVDFGKSSLIDKARKQPDKVKMVLDKIKTDGLVSTVDAVRSKLAQPLPLGYCHVGEVIDVADDVTEFSVGDRVISNGPHADIVRVPKHLCAKIPDNVDDESAAFTVLASIGLQGIRLAQPTLGEHFVVIGAGLIGLLTIQLLIANGCKVLAIDLDNEKLALARTYGAETCNPKEQEDVVNVGMQFSHHQGVDGVIITASTASNEPVSQAANMSRKRGRIILVGVTGLSLNRSEFYEKELSFQVSCSYGPGRYDPSYEDQGQDYPIGFVRWTEQRNFQAILDMMASNRLSVSSLISHRFQFDNAVDAYQLLTDDKSALGIVLEYPQNDRSQTLRKSLPISDTVSVDAQKVSIGVIGAGNYASRVLIPALKSSGAQLHTIASSGGINSVIHGKNNGFQYATTDVADMLANTDINTIVIATQHNSHASFVCQALAAKKHVFVEKPLAITQEQHQRIADEIEKNTHNSALMVGYNRRFSPHIQKMKALLAPISEPKSLIMTMNAGAIPADHWVHDSEKGGGRIIGEACHFIDLMRYLVGSEIVSVQARQMSKDSTEIAEDKAVIVLGFADGSFGTIHYLANGAQSYPKEKIEVFAANKVLSLDNFRKLRGYGFSNFKKMNLWQQDKGQAACAQAFVDAINNGKASPIPLNEILEVSRVTLQAAKLLSQQED